MNARIKCLVDLFPHGSYLLDIGSDHGYLGLELLKLEKTIGVCNVDLSKTSLQQSEKIYKKLGFQEKAKFICGNGFKCLKDENIPFDTVVTISGLGSSQILRILEHMPTTIRSLILMSHTDYYMIRTWAWSNNWNIHDEKYVEERGYYYMAMRLVRSSGKREDYSMEEYIFGKKKFREFAGSLFDKFWEEKSKRIIKIPEEHRSLSEKESIRFLLREKIIKNIKIYEDS